MGEAGVEPDFGHYWDLLDKAIRQYESGLVLRAAIMAGAIRQNQFSMAQTVARGFNPALHTLANLYVEYGISQYDEQVMNFYLELGTYLWPDVEVLKTWALNKPSRCIDSIVDGKPSKTQLFDTFCSEKKQPYLDYCRKRLAQVKSQLFLQHTDTPVHYH